MAITRWGYIMDNGKVYLKVVYADGLTSYSPAMGFRSHKAWAYRGWRPREWRV